MSNPTSGIIRADVPLPTNTIRRLFSCVFRQEHSMKQCGTYQAPDFDLTGKTAVVTGGNGGIGFETCKGLVRQGARVIIGCRRLEEGKRAATCLRQENETAEVECFHLDLQDLKSVSKFCQDILALLPNGLDILVCNAGVWPQTNATSAQGYEIAFATNVLGHFYLIQLVLSKLQACKDSRVVMLTGDIYCLASECSSNFSPEPWDGKMAYCRSKLGNIWLAKELARRYSTLTSVIVHPGVINTNLGGSGGAWLKQWLLISPERGAQTTLYCCGADTAVLTSGGYYHNTWGEVQFPDNDPALDAEKALALWTLCQDIVGNHS